MVRPRFYRGLALRSSSGPHPEDIKKATSVAVGPFALGISDHQIYAGFNRRSHLMQIGMADPAIEDVELDILYCGVCHSDLHQV